MPKKITNISLNFVRINYRKVFRNTRYRKDSDKKK